MKYKVTFPFIPDMGTVSPMIVQSGFYETAQEQALWHLNSMRDHDGQNHLKTLPKKTKFEVIED